MRRTSKCNGDTLSERADCVMFWSPSTVGDIDCLHSEHGAWKAAHDIGHWENDAAGAYHASHGAGARALAFGGNTTEHVSMSFPHPRMHQVIPASHVLHSWMDVQFSRRVGSTRLPDTRSMSDTNPGTTSWLASIERERHWSSTQPLPSCSMSYHGPSSVREAARRATSIGPPRPDTARGCGFSQRTR